MAYHVELRGTPLSSRASRTQPYVLQRSVTTEHAVGERPVAGLSVRVPPGATFSPEDFDELTIDYPVLPYRAAAERDAGLVAYWRLDEAPVTQAADSEGATPLTFGGGNGLQYRAHRSESAAVPYGAAPEWTHTSGAGLSGTLPSAIGTEFTIAGFVRMAAGAAGVRDVWAAGAANRRLRVDADGSIACRMGTGTLTAPAGTITEDAWHHVAVRRTSTSRELWVDGAMVGSQSGGGASFDGRAWTMAVAVASDAVNLALDEWGVWSSAIDVAALYARRDAYRQFGGYIFGIVDRTDIGPDDRHVLDLSVTGYGFRLDSNYVREVYASATGDTVREIVQDVLERAGLADDFSSHGVELNDIVTRAVYPVESVMNILRSLATDHGAIVVVDEWREIDIVRRNNVEESDLLLDNSNVASIGSKTEPRFYANRSIVVGRGEVGTYELSFTTDGVTRRYDSPQPIGDILSITVDGVDETFEGTGARWEVDADQQRFELAAGETPSGAGKDLKIAFVALPALTVTVDNATALADVGFAIARRFEDDAIDTVGGRARRRAGTARPGRPALPGLLARDAVGQGAARATGRGANVHLPAPRPGRDTPVGREVQLGDGRAGDRARRRGPSGRVVDGATALDYPGSEGDDFRTSPRPTVRSLRGPAGRG